MARRWLLAALGTTIVSLALAAGAAADPFTAADPDDANSDGVCATAATCTLRDAVDAAMGTAGDDVITVTADAHLVKKAPVEVDSGNGKVTINGAGSDATFINGSSENNIFLIWPDAELDLTGAELRNGKAEFGGAIMNAGTLTLDDVIVTNNNAVEDGGGIYNGENELPSRGGAVVVVPELIARNSSIGISDAGNTAEQGHGGGIFNFGGIVVLDNTDVVGNSAARHGGGILHREDFTGPEDDPAEMTIQNGSRINENFASQEGGGIRAKQGGFVRITDSEVAGNHAEERAGGVLAKDGTELTLLRTLIADNNSRSGTGGGLHIEDTTAEITESTVRDNGFDCNGNGGGIFVVESIVDVLRSTISGNGFQSGLPCSTLTGNGDSAATDNGGGMLLEDGSIASLTNTTVSGNIALTGGGINVAGGFLRTGTSPLGLGFPSTLDLLHVTITGNTAFSKGSPGGAGIWNGFADPPSFFAGAVDMKSTLLSNNLIHDSDEKNNCAATPESINSEGTNLEDADTCGFEETPGDGDLINTDPVIGGLAGNGGPTATHALLAGSPAIHAADNDGCPSEDQRNVTRPQGPACDIGAYEAEVSEPGVTSTPAPGAAPVAGTTPAATPGRPRVRIAGVRRSCVRTSFVARFRITVASGARLRSVRVTVDGRRVSTRRRSRLALRINVRRLRAGRHRLRIVVTDSAGNRRTVNRTFTKCAQRAQRRAAPRFTG